jgi:hypothetical protein
MSNRSSLPVGCGFVVTQDGHDALISGEACDCALVLRGGLFVCLACDTVWGRASFSRGGAAEVHVPAWSRER